MPAECVDIYLEQSLDGAVLAAVPQQKFSAGQKRMRSHHTRSEPVVVITSELQELELKIQMEKEFAHRGAKQVRAIKDSDEKVVALERTLQGFVEDFEKERAHMRQQWEKAATDMATEVDGYRRLAEVRFGLRGHCTARF